MRLVTVREMQAIERGANGRGLTYDEMMEHAGGGLSDVVENAYSQYRAEGVLGLVGSGNNGGDTLVALANLSQMGWKAAAYVVQSRLGDDPLIQRLVQAGGRVYFIEQDQNYDILRYKLNDHRVILDGILGTGIKLPLRGKIVEVLEFTKKMFQKGGDTHIVVAVDCPSGIDCDSGEAAPEVLSADLTVTMAAIKKGLLLFPAAGYTGNVVVVGIGLDDQDSLWEPVNRIVIDQDWVSRRLPRRPMDAHKGTFGTTLVVAGSVNYTGAALLAGKAAYLSGAGLVTLAVVEPLQVALAGHFPEATWILLPHENGAIAKSAWQIIGDNLGRATAMLVGPGLGLAKTTGKFMSVLVKPEKLREAYNIESLPLLVIDADGLRLVSNNQDWYKWIPATSILTPHPGEMAAMCGEKIQDIQSDRLGIAEKYARLWGHILVLKGANTIISSPDGRTAIIPVASPALARAGSGDVLAGLIVGLRTQGVEAFEAAAMGAWIHAQAGLYAARDIGAIASVLAGNILNGIIGVMRDLEAG